MPENESISLDALLLISKQVVFDPLTAEYYNYRTDIYLSVDDVYYHKLPDPELVMTLIDNQPFPFKWSIYEGCIKLDESFYKAINDATLSN